MLFALLHLFKDLFSAIFLGSSPTSLIDFCQDAQKHFAPQKSLTLEGWNSSLPTQEEKQQMRALLIRFYQMPTFESQQLSLDEYPALVPWLNITRIRDYIVIHEKFPRNGGLFARNWGLLALCDPRIIHHSAVHFDSEGPIYEEAAYIAQESKSRSLAYHGASRYALKQNVSSSCNRKYTLTDGAHNDDTMFHLWSSTLLELSRSRGENFSFVQWHGMAETSCSSSDAFVSIGTAKSTNYGGDCPAERIRRGFNYVAAPLVCATPLEDASCKLIGSDNPLGRLINGVPPEKLCSEKAKDENIKGEFIHIEQKARVRIALNKWIRAFIYAFPASRPGFVKAELA